MRQESTEFASDVVKLDGFPEKCGAGLVIGTVKITYEKGEEGNGKEQGEAQQKETADIGDSGVSTLRGVALFFFFFLFSLWLFGFLSLLGFLSLFHGFRGKCLGRVIQRLLRNDNLWGLGLESVFFFLILCHRDVVSS